MKQSDGSKRNLIGASMIGIGVGLAVGAAPASVIAGAATATAAFLSFKVATRQKPSRQT